MGEARSTSDELLLGRALNLMGVICKEIGRLRRSEACYRRALPLFLRGLGPLHPAVATTYHNLGGILYARGCLGRAEGWARRAVAVRAKALGRRHADVMADEAALAVILASRGKHAEAEVIYRRAIRFYAARAGLGYEVAINANNLAVLLESAGRRGPAERFYRRALRLYESTAGSPPHDRALALYNLGVLRAKAGGRDAFGLVEEAHAIFARTLGARHRLTREARGRLTELRAPARCAQS